MIFCHVLFASLVFYFATTLANASPLVAPQSQVREHPTQQQQTVQDKSRSQIEAPDASKKKNLSPVATRSALEAVQPSTVLKPITPVASAAAPELVENQPIGIIKPVIVRQSDTDAQSPVVIAPAAPMITPSKPIASVVSPLPEPRLLEEKSATAVDKSHEFHTVNSSPIVASGINSAQQVTLEAAKPKDESVLSERKAPEAVGERMQMPEKPVAVVKLAPPAAQAPVSPPLATEVKAVAAMVPKGGEEQPQKRKLEAKRLDVEQAKSAGSVLKPVALATAPMGGSIEAKEQIEQRSQPMVQTQPKAVESVVKKEGDSSDTVQKAATDPFLSEKKEEIAAVEQKKIAESEQLRGKMSAEPEPHKPPPLVNGGLGPLHLLATTLCSYQPDRQVADDIVNQLYARRAIVRKALFDFMSLKFTNLEKLSSRLGYGLQVVPVKSVPDPTSSSQLVTNKPSHGWPIVGKCTAHDLKLMGEAAWCECYEGDQDCKPSGQQVVAAPADHVPVPVDGSNKPVERQEEKEMKPKSARSIVVVDSFSPEQSSVISKILHVGDIKDAPVVESTFYNLNLTQQQLETLEAQATSTQECRRNALRYSKALFQHLAEDQHIRSASWPKLYAQISSNDCARKRMIDIVNALSSFRTDTTSIRRDNVEFAFAMDDLRTKVLENEVNVPLTFDRHFIEVEQFLQQSVRLMLASVQPKRAKLTSMRYRSLMYGSSASVDDQQQCIDLHQRLLAKNYLSDCDPTQFGQLPDVLRMTANSLELWSIEKELSLHLAKIADYPNSTPDGQQKVKEDVNECIANLVAS